MKVFVLFVFAFCVQSSHQQLNRQHQTQSLTYSDADFNPLPPVTRATTTTTTTEEPDTTTKKKGFFSGFTGLFKSKDKDTTTTTQQPSTTKKLVQIVTTTTTLRPTTTTVKSLPSNAPVTSASTPKVPPRTDSPTPPPRPPSQHQSSSTTVAPRKTTKDEFSPLPTQPGGRPSVQQPTAPSYPAPPPPSSPNASGKLPGQPQGNQQTTPPPSAWGKPPGQPQGNQQPTPLPSAWGKPPGQPQVPSGPTPKPPTYFIQSSSTTKKPQVSSQPSQSVDSGPVTDAELLTLSDSLFSKDIHNPFKYVTVNYQGRTQSSAKTDEAPQPLLNIDEKLFTVNTVEKMQVMYNNYEQDTAINEYVSPNERKEEDEFLEAVLATPVMRHAMNFLMQKGIVTADPATHRDVLKTIWFNLYSRGMGKIGSSGFEHVFLSEVKNGTVMGLHNWIYMSEAEKAGDLDYKGWTKKIDLGNKGQIAKVRFTLNNLEKPSNSLFIGTSPELELALYTVCFELRADKDCRLAYGGKDFNIVTHSYRYRGKNLIGSAYPEI